MTVARLAFTFSALCAVAPGCSSPDHGAPATVAGEPPAVVTAPLVAEARFFDVPPQAHGATYAARMFTSFRPVGADAEHAPLVVFFNGGPGSATSLGLLAYGTGPMTLDPADLDRTVPTGEGAVADTPVAKPNARAFTRFANTLYVDERLSGFSYGIREGKDGPLPPYCQFSIADDAADYLRALLAFYDAHEALRRAPLVLVGESYGGMRASAMVSALLGYRDAGLPDDLVGSLQAHFDKLSPATAGTTHSRAEIAARLRVVLIQPLVLGDLQEQAQVSIIDSDPYVGQAWKTGPSPYDVRQRADYDDRVAVQASRAFAVPASARALLGVDLAAVPRLVAGERGLAFRSQSNMLDAPSERALEAELGPLSDGDGYLSSFSRQCDGGQITEPDAPNNFGRALYDVPFLITRARYDAIIYTPAIPAALEGAGWAVTLDEAARPGVPRPGWFTVAIPAGADRPAKKVEVRFPHYDDSGHMVTVTQGGDLADDVAAWLGSL